MSKKKLLIYSDSPNTSTGFSREIVPLILYFAEKFEVHYFGVFCPEDMEVPICKVYGASRENFNDVYGKDRFPKILDALKPDLVFANQDLQVINEVVLGHTTKRKIPLINWSILDCPILPEEYYQMFLGVDHHIFQTQFTKNVVGKSLFYIKAKDFPVIYPPIHDLFFKAKKMEDKERKKRLLCVAKNIPRKYITTLLEAMAILKKYDEEFELVLHSQDLPNHANITVNLKRFIDQLRLKNVVFPYNEKGSNIVKDTELVSLYAQCDMFVSTSGREGVGIPFLEAMAIGLPCIGVNHSAVGEMLGSYEKEHRGCLLQPVARQYEPGGGQICNALVNPEDVAAAIYAFLIRPDEYHKKILEKWVDLGHEFANQLQPKLIAEQLMQQFEMVLEDNPAKKEYLKTLHCF